MTDSPLADTSATATTAGQQVVVLHHAPAAALLRGHGFDVVEAEHGEGVLARLRSGATIAAVIGQVTMPGLNGFDLCRRARALSPGMLVILTGANPEITDYLSALGGRFVSSASLADMLPLLGCQPEQPAPA